MDFSAELVGFKELAETLRELPGNLGKNVLRSAVMYGALAIQDEAKQNALRMKKTGTLARSIYRKQIRELSGPEKQTVYVGARSGKLYQKNGKKGTGRDAYYAKWVELGHFTRPAKGQRATRNGVIAHGVRWVPGRPFLRPAFDARKELAVESIGLKISDRLKLIKAGKR